MILSLILSESDYYIAAATDLLYNITVKLPKGSVYG